MGFYNRRRLYQQSATKPTRITVSKAASALLATSGYDQPPAQLQGTGKGGSITKRDVSNWLTANHRPQEEE